MEGFEIGFVFAFPESERIFVILVRTDTYKHLRFLEIGFVLHKKGWICRGLSTNVERRQRRVERKNKVERKKVDFVFR